MEIEQISVLLIIIGSFLFLGCGISVANSIEAKESKKVADVLTVFTVLGMLMCIIGLIGLMLSLFI